MRTMMTIQIPVDAGNAAVADGRLSKVIGETLDRWKPEAAYFTAVGGDRGGFLVFDLRIPAISRRFANRSSPSSARASN